MRFNVGRLSEPFLFLVALVSVVVLWSSACALVWTQYRVRLLFTEIEVSPEELAQRHLEVRK